MHYSGFSIVMYGETKLAVSPKRKRKSKILFYFLLIWSRAIRARVKSMLSTVLNIILNFFFKLSRKNCPK